jgi:hypothetical protein
MIPGTKIGERSGERVTLDLIRTKIVWYSGK